MARAAQVGDLAVELARHARGNVDLRPRRPHDLEPLAMDVRPAQEAHEPARGRPRAHGIDDAQVDMDSGAVWLGSQPQPTGFPLGDLRPHLESFLRHDLVRILRTAADEARWHLHYRCEWCDFFRHCWSEMQRRDDLSRLSRLTSWGKRFLNERAGVRTTAELGEFLQRPDADETLSRCASLAGSRPRLAKQLAALEQDFIVGGNVLNGWFFGFFFLGALWVHVPIVLALVAGWMEEMGLARALAGEG